MPGRWSARVAVVALLCGVLVAVATPTAGATPPAVHEAPVSAKVTKLPPDGTCDPNPDYPQDPGEREDFAGVVRTRLGPARIGLRLCHMFTGAIASTRLYGTFSIRTFAGTLHGSVDGGEEHTPYEYAVLTLTVERGTWWLFNVRGTMHLEGQVGPQPGFAGTLTSDLHRSWGHWHAATPFPLT